MNRIVAALAALLLLFGCASRPPADARVRFARDVGARISVSGVRLVDGADGFRTLRATFDNGYGGDRGVEWRVQWLDPDGVEIESAASSWNKLMLTGNSSTSVRNTAIRREAVDFRLHVRRLRD